MNNETLAVTLPVLPIKRTVLVSWGPDALDGRTCTVDRRRRGGDENRRKDDSGRRTARSPDRRAGARRAVHDRHEGHRQTDRPVRRWHDPCARAGARTCRITQSRTDRTRFFSSRLGDSIGRADKATEVQALHRAIQELVTDLPRLIQAPGIQEAAAAFSNEDNPVCLGLSRSLAPQSDRAGRAKAARKFVHDRAVAIAVWSPSRKKSRYYNCGTKSPTTPKPRSERPNANMSFVNN